MADEIIYNCNKCGLDITANRIGNYIRCLGCGNSGDLASTAIPSQLEQLAQSEKNKTGPESSVPNPGFSNMMGRPTGHRHDPGFDDYKGYSNYSGPSGHRHE